MGNTILLGSSEGFVDADVAASRFHYVGQRLVILYVNKKKICGQKLEVVKKTSQHAPSFVFVLARPQRIESARVQFPTRLDFV